jgi:hypothetical protein
MKRVSICLLVLIAIPWDVVHAQGQSSKARSFIGGQEGSPEVVSKAWLQNYSANSASRSGFGTGAPVSTLDAPGEAPRIPTLLVSTNACSQRAGNPGGVGVSTSLRDAIGDCIRDLPAYRPPANGDRPRRPNLQGALWSALDEVRRLAPHPRLAIAPGRIGLTGLESYFWLAEPVSPVTATASVPGLRVVAEAAPDHYLWRFEPGADLITNHPGRPWTATRPGNIGHTYETKGRYDVLVEVVWRARWRIGSGAWRELGFFSTVDSRRYPVREIVPILTQG